MSLHPQRSKQLLLLLLAASLIFVIVLATGSRISAKTRHDLAAKGLEPAAYLPALNTAVPPIPDSLSIVPFGPAFNASGITEITHAGDERLFIAEREGIIRILNPDGTLVAPAFLNVKGPDVSTFNWEQGLLGLAFHPDYANNGFFYILYTANPKEDVRIMRYRVSANNPNLADPNSGVLLMQIKKPLDNTGEPSEVHNGGSMHFGPDGYLYIGVGDGGPDPWLGDPSPGDPNNYGQRTDRLLGKILRIDVDGLNADCGNANNGIPPENIPPSYGVPPGNPLADGPGGDCDEIWATGLRNPWRISFDRDTGDLYIGDVGEWRQEEIDFQPAGTAGLNYGWHCYEGDFDYAHRFPEIADDCQLPIDDYTFPIFEYGHTTACSSVTGGFVYRGSNYLGLLGQYVFADFCTGRIWRTGYVDDSWQTALVADVDILISTFGQDLNGELYIGSYTAGAMNSRVLKVVVP